MTNINELKYAALLKDVLDNGFKKQDRTGVGTISDFSNSLSFEMSSGFPILTGKKIHFKSIVHELLWMISGNTNVNYLRENGVTIWDEWSPPDGNLGPVYGHQWRNWNSESIDQLSSVIEAIKTDPDSRRHIVTAWNPSQLKQMALPPCHILFQFYCFEEQLTDSISQPKISINLYQRSADLFLGLPFNITFYSMLLYIVGRLVNRVPHKLTINIGDAHIYTNHIEQVKTYLSRTLTLFSPPTFEVHGFNNINELKPEHFFLYDYKSHPTIKAPIAV